MYAHHVLHQSNHKFTILYGQLVEDNIPLGLIKLLTVVCLYHLEISVSISHTEVKLLIVEDYIPLGLIKLFTVEYFFFFGQCSTTTRRPKLSAGQARAARSANRRASAPLDLSMQHFFFDATNFDAMQQFSSMIATKK